MYKYLFRYSVLFYFLLLSVLLSAQQPSQLKSFLTVDEGLSHNEVTSIAQDQDGFIWIGNRGGLNRYDGYRVAENTIIVFTSDNGGSIGGRSTMPGNAPCRGPEGRHKSTTVFLLAGRNYKIPGEQFSTLDILSTVLDASGIQPNENIDGKSLLSYPRNSNETIQK